MGEKTERLCSKVTHSDEGEDVVHVGPDVDLDETHHHSHLLEKELPGNKQKRSCKHSKQPKGYLLLFQQRTTHLSNTGITHSDDIEESGHNLGQELNTLEAQRLENEGYSLHHHSVVVGE